MNKFSFLFQLLEAPNGLLDLPLLKCLQRQVYCLILHKQILSLVAFIASYSYYCEAATEPQRCVVCTKQ